MSFAAISGLLTDAVAQDEPGVTIEYGYTAEITSVAKGVNGVSEGPLYLDNVDLIFGFSTEGLGLWKGGTATAYFLSNLGDDPSGYAGDAQVTSNIEADDTRRLYELWYNQSFAGGLVEALVGVHDLNSEYYTNEAAGLFTNSSFGIGADVAGSVPVGIFNLAAASARLRVNVNDNLSVQASVYDGLPGDPAEVKTPLDIEWSDEEGLMTIAEAAYWVAGQDGEETPQAYRVGFWHHSAEVAAFDDSTDLGGISGLYFSVDQPLNDNITTFVTGGFASSGRAAVPLFFGVGAHTTNGFLSLLGGDREETLGLAMAAAKIENIDQDGVWTNDPSWEMAFEATWSVQVNDIFSIQPDLQYVINAGGVSGESALVVGVRTSIGF
ncbi:carbohydrate porin [Candidatus Neomarinimicrobiota bacterium]